MLTNDINEWLIIIPTHLIQWHVGLLILQEAVKEGQKHNKADIQCTL